MEVRYITGSREEDQQYRTFTHEIQDTHRLPAGFYLGYWEQLRKSNKKLGKQYPDFTKTLQQTERSFIRNDARIDDLDRNRRVEHYKQIEEWYRRAGSLNTMQGAHVPLMNAARILERPIEQEHMHPGQRLLIPAQFFEAALVSYDEETKLQLLAEAHHWYQEVAEDPRLDSYSGVKEEAQRHGYDVRFETLRSNALHEEWTSENMQRFIDLQKHYIEDFLGYLWACELRLKELSSEANNENYIRGFKGMVSGLAYEWFVPLMFRHNQIIKNDFAGRSIRNSLPREEHPIFNPRGENRKHTGPRHSIDAVVQRYDEDGNEMSRDWLQLKTSSYGHKKYLSEIDPTCAEIRADRSNLEGVKIKSAEIGNFDKFVAVLVECAQEAQNQYANGEPQASELIQVGFKLSNIELQPAA